MFTGLIQAIGRVIESTETPAGCRLVVDPGDWAGRWESPPAHGDSIAVSGVCLTLARPGVPLAFDIITETLEKSSLGALEAGDRVNLEPSLRADSLLGGHIVQGHVDGLGEVAGVASDADDWRVRIRPRDSSLMDFIAPKGSVTVEGVSLTVARVEADSFEIALIPTTLEKTTLGALRGGQSVNLETDIIARSVVNYLKRREGAG